MYLSFSSKISFNRAIVMTSSATTMMTFNVTTNNGTYENVPNAERSQWQQDMVELVQQLILVALILIMLGVGCSLELKMIIRYVKRPAEFITGLCLQLIGMPLVGFSITQILQMDTPEALGVILQAIAPGGGYSNLVTYWLDGDMNLSIVMTGTSTLLAFGSMSFWLFIISKILKLEQKFLIPYKSLVTGAASTIIPIIVGMIFQHFFPKIASKITKIFSVIASIIVIVTFILNGVAGVYDYPVTYKVFLAATVMISVAVLFGYAASRVPWLNLELSCRRTIAIETVYQNTPVAFSIIVLTFSSADPAIFGPMSFFPILYLLVLLSATIIVIVAYQLLKAKGVKWVSPHNPEKNMDTSGEAGVADALMQKKASAVVS